MTSIRTGGNNSEATSRPPIAAVRSTTVRQQQKPDHDVSRVPDAGPESLINLNGETDKSIEHALIDVGRDLRNNKDLMNAESEDELSSY